MEWFVYILECCDSTYYIGMTRNLSRRLSEHTFGKGAVYTALRQPVNLVGAVKIVDSNAKATKWLERVLRYPMAEEVRTAIINSADQLPLEVLKNTWIKHGMIEGCEERLAVLAENTQILSPNELAEIHITDCLTSTISKEISDSVTDNLNDGSLDSIWLTTKAKTALNKAGINLVSELLTLSAQQLFDILGIKNRKNPMFKAIEKRLIYKNINPPW